MRNCESPTALTTPSLFAGGGAIDSDDIDKLLVQSICCYVHAQAANGSSYHGRQGASVLQQLQKASAAERTVVSMCELDILSVLIACDASEYGSLKDENLIPISGPQGL